jgi:hypothetical protein
MQSIIEAKNGETVAIETIAPQRAAADLEYSAGKNYRHMNKDHVKAYVKILRQHGRFDFNGNTIVYDENGYLKDGQHRFQAIVDSGVSCEMLIVRNVKSDVNIDSGKKRNIADVLRSMGESDSKVLAATLRVVWRYDNGILFSFRHAGDQSASNDEIIRTLNRHPNVRQSVSDAAKYTSKNVGYIPQSLLAAVLYIAASTDKDMADDFIHDLVQQVNLEEDNAAYVLHQRLHNIKNKDNVAQDKLGKLAILVKAWNAYARGQSVRSLRFIRSGKQAEAFPEFITKKEIESLKETV